MHPVPDFAAHRARLLEALPEDHGVILFGAPHPLRNGDAEYRYRPDSDLFWLTGWPDPECALLVRHGEEPFALFVQPKDPEREVWTGRRPGPEGATADYGMDRAAPIDELPEALVDFMAGLTAVHHAIGRDADHDALVLGAVRKARRAARKTGDDVPTTFHTLEHLLHRLRLIKGDDEIAVLRRAAELSARAHVEAMAAAAPGVHEYEIDALLEASFRRQGGTGAGYTNIVAGGDNANILHYIRNDQPLRDGDLLLIDAGGEHHFYTADITRTFPVNGRFTEPQRRVYDIVLDAQLKAIDHCRPGRTWKEVHDLATRVLTEGMVALGLLEGDVDALIEEGAHKTYYMHGTGHWLGLDVHDVGPYAGDGGQTLLEPGVVLTVEPGLYIPADDESAPEALRGIGVRIEDDVLVTIDAPEVLTAGVPKHPDEVEAVCQGRA